MPLANLAGRCWSTGGLEGAAAAYRELVRLDPKTATPGTT